MARILVARVSVVVVLVSVAALAALALSGTPNADACGRSMVAAPFIPETVAKSEVVAIGEFVGGTERAAEFRIDEPLRGPGVGTILQVDNRTAYTFSACSPYDEPFHEGGRFSPGDRKLVILEREVDGLWQVGFSSDTAWDVPEDELQPLIQDFWVDQTPLPRLVSVEADLAARAATLGSDLGFEGRTPCNPTQELGHRIRTSTLVVIGEVDPASDRQSVRIKRVLAGEASASEVTVNHRVRRDWDTCDVVLDPPRAPSSYDVSGEVLLFLRPDEFGVADYRPALWGTAVEPVNERYLTENLPTLRGIRDAVAAAPAPSPLVTSSPVEVNDETRFKRWYVAAGSAAILVAIALAGWRWQTRRTPN